MADKLYLMARAGKPIKDVFGEIETAVEEAAECVKAGVAEVNVYECKLVTSVKMGAPVVVAAEKTK